MKKELWLKPIDCDAAQEAGQLARREVIAAGESVLGDMVLRGDAQMAGIC
ncbi:hypothetical protein [Streptomyces sp. NPDC005970]